MQRAKKIIIFLLLVTVYLYPVKQDTRLITPEQTVEIKQAPRPFYSRWLSTVYDTIILPIQNNVQSFFTTIQSTFFGKKETPVIETAQPPAPPSSKEIAQEDISKFPIVKPSPTDRTPLPTLEQVAQQRLPSTPSYTTLPPIPEPKVVQTTEPMIPTPYPAPEITESKLTQFARLAVAKTKRITNKLIPRFNASSWAQETQNFLNYIQQEMDPLLSTQMKLGAVHIADTSQHVDLLLAVTKNLIDNAPYKDGERTELHEEYTDLYANYNKNQPYFAQTITQRITEQSAQLITDLANPENLVGEKVYLLLQQFDAYAESINALFKIISNEQHTDSVIENSLSSAFISLHTIITLFPIKFTLPQKADAKFYESFMTQIKNKLTGKITQAAASSHAFSQAITVFGPEAAEEKIDFDNNFCLLTIQSYIYDHILQATPALIEKFAQHSSKIRIHNQKKLFVSLSADNYTRSLELENRNNRFSSIVKGKQSAYQTTMTRKKAEDFLTYLIAFYEPLERMKIDQQSYVLAKVLFDITKLLSESVGIINNNLVTQLFTQISGLSGNIATKVDAMRTTLKNAQKRVYAELETSLEYRNIQLIEKLSQLINQHRKQTPSEIDSYLHLCDEYATATQKSLHLVKNDIQQAHLLYQKIVDLIPKWSERYKSASSSSTSLDLIADYLKYKLLDLTKLYTDLQVISEQEGAATRSTLGKFPREKIYFSPQEDLPENESEYFDAEEDHPDFS